MEFPSKFNKHDATKNVSIVMFEKVDKLSIKTSSTSKQTNKLIIKMQKENNKETH